MQSRVKWALFLMYLFNVLMVILISYLLQIRRDKITKLVVLPLYPQFSISTTGSSIRVLQNLFRWNFYFFFVNLDLVLFSCNYFVVALLWATLIWDNCTGMTKFCQDFLLLLSSLGISVRVMSSLWLTQLRRNCKVLAPLRRLVHFQIMIRGSTHLPISGSIQVTFYP